MRYLVCLLLAGCFQIEAEIEESCITRTGIEIEAAPSDRVMHTFTIDDMSEAHRLLEYDASLQFMHANVRASIDLDFVTRAAIAVEGEPVYACEGDCASLPALAHDDATHYLAAESLEVTLAVEGELPRVAWSADVDICFRGTLGYAY